MYNILVSNDDGIASPSLQILVDALAKVGNVYVLAPNKGMSAKSHSITLYEDIYINEVEYKNALKAYALSGTPVDCIIVGKDIFKVDFDFVFSGINLGHNLGTDIIYSATVSVARQGAMHDVPSFAISHSRRNSEIAKNEIDNVIKYIFDNKLFLEHKLYNINFPISKYTSSKGIKICKQGIKDFINNFYIDGEKALSTVEKIIYDDDITTDVYLAKEGYITICPLIIKQTDFDILNKLKKKLKD